MMGQQRCYMGFGVTRAELGKDFELRVQPVAFEGVLYLRVDRIVFPNKVGQAVAGVTLELERGAQRIAVPLRPRWSDAGILSYYVDPIPQSLRVHLEVTPADWLVLRGFGAADAGVTVTAGAFCVLVSDDEPRPEFLQAASAAARKMLKR